jgi:hypothetical protein
MLTAVAVGYGMMQLASQSFHPKFEFHSCVLLGYLALLSDNA